MFNKKKIDIKDLPFAYMEEGMCAHCGCRLSTTKMNGKFICGYCRVLYKKCYIKKFYLVNGMS